MPVIFFRAPRWSFTVSTAERLNRLQRKMFRIVLPVRMLPGETPELFNRRAARIASQLQHDVGPWGVLWAVRVITWAAHVLRDTKHKCWSAKILDVRSSRELSERRAERHNRPETRKQGGFLSRRWTDSVPVAIDFVDKFMCAQANGIRLYAGLGFALPKVRSNLPPNSKLLDCITFVRENMYRL